ncbi:MAG: NYN domain-containing protein [Eubacterium sp.]|nr:NYN domain-containing protein [Eubacterium sp.]
MDGERKYAVLIDADNVSRKYIKAILEEVSNFGVATYKRIYGDWTRNNGWKDALLDNSILPVQQYSYTSGKNATDSAMIIDAMDILYSGNVDGFCLVSSDSDFTRLAARLREDGMYVIGMGENKTPSAFRRACNVFRILEIISGEHTEPDTDAVRKEEGITTVSDIENAVRKIIMENSNQGKETQIGEVGSKLNLLYPDFDVRNYGYSKLTTFLKDSCSAVRFSMKHNQIVLGLNERQEDIISIVKGIILAEGGEIENMSLLNEEIKKQIPGFNVENYGYNKFGKFIRSLPGIESTGPNCIRLKNK